MSDMNAWNQAIIAAFYANGGKGAGAPFLLLHTRGARSGQPRVNPLAHPRDGERYVVSASKGGAPTNPDWYHHVVAQPLIMADVGTDQFQAQAPVPIEPERPHVYDLMAQVMPGVAAYQRTTTRPISVVVRTRCGAVPVPRSTPC